MVTIVDKNLAGLLSKSLATAEFKKGIRIYIDGLDTELISCPPGSPRIKVLRVLTKLLEVFPDKKISRVAIDGRSSCSSYEGVLTFEPGNTQIRFIWDCYWKAEKEGMIAWYGMPDQTKAAQTFGYQCFKKFEMISPD